MAEAQMSVAQAELIGLVLHSFLYGLYNVLFAQSLHWPWQPPSRRPRNTVLTSVTCALWVLITAHWGVQISRAIQAFIDTVGTVSAIGDPATEYYAFPANPMNITKEALYLMQTFLGDFTMVYRAWVVWNRNYFIVIFPALILAGFGVSAVVVCVVLAQTTPGENIFISAAGSWAISVFVTSVALNLVTTSLITFRVWHVKRGVTGTNTSVSSGVMSVVHIIVESAALYTICAILTLIGYSTKQTWQFITIDIISPIIGIAFTLIAVRVNSVSSGDTTHSSSRGENSAPRYPGMGSRRPTYKNGPIAVNVSQQISTHADGDDSKDEMEMDGYPAYHKGAAV